MTAGPYESSVPMWNPNGDKKLYPKLNIVEFEFLGVETKLKLNNKLKWVNPEFRFRNYIEYLQLNTLKQHIIEVKRHTVVTPLITPLHFWPTLHTNTQYAGDTYDSGGRSGAGSLCEGIWVFHTNLQSCGSRVPTPCSYCAQAPCLYPHRKYCCGWRKSRKVW